MNEIFNWYLSIYFTDEEIDPQPPPIPPRRKKRKKNLPAILASEPTLKPSSKPRRKPRLPPPPPPPVQKTSQKRSQFVNSSHRMKEPESDLENNSTTETESIPFEVKFNIGEENRNSEVRPNFQNLNQNRFQNRNIHTYPPQHREPNRYPPLLFTFQDFQTVMAESISNRDYQTSLDETFSSNNLIDESKVCFRVTTTNLPFEKCLGTWQNSFDNPEFVASDENSFIFEDYIDRSNRPARPDLFRMESLENSVEDIVPNRTKVRFVIESPSTSTPDEDAEITMDSLQNIESLNKDLEELQKIQSICEAIQNSERDLPLDSLLCDSDTLNLVEIVSETDLICENVFESEGTDDNKVINKGKIDVKEQVDKEITDDTEKIEDEEEDLLDVSKLDIQSSSDEIIEKGSPEKEVKKILENPKLERFKTCVSADQCTLEISKSEKSEENLERPKEVSHSSKLQRFKTQKSTSGNYEDAFGSDELMLNKSSEVSEDKVVETSEDPDNQNISIENQEVKAGEENSKKKIFIDSSLCDFINNGNEGKWNDSSDKDRESSFANLESEVKIDPSPQVSSISVSVRRNSFLDKMLNEETCEVIATHPKPADSMPEKGMQPALELESPSQEFPALSTSSERKVVWSSKSDESKNEVQKGKILVEKKVVKKSFGEAKCEVLNELLCNFSAIKLKSVPSSKTIDRVSSANHVKLPDESVCEQKTDQLRVEEDGSASARATDPSEALASVEDQLISVDKCAIARRSPKTCNNSIDNNAKTPVALSNDQSHDAFSITPGSVRNFIKHYEIQQETSNQCFKDKDVKDKYVKATDDRNKDLSSKEEIETLELKEEIDQDSLIDLMNLESNESIGRRKSLNFIENSKQEFESSCQSLTTNGTKGKKQSCIKSNDSSPISERKKSVQFDSACTVIQLQKQEESSMTSLINGIRYRIKGKAPNKPEVQMPITFKTSLRPDDSTPDIQVSQHSFLIVV